MWQGCLSALTGKASDAVEMILSGIAAYRATGATIYMPLLCRIWRAPMQTLGGFKEAWRCIDEAMT